MQKATVTGIANAELKVCKADDSDLFRVRPDTGYLVYNGTGANNNHLIKTATKP